MSGISNETQANEITKSRFLCPIALNTTRTSPIYKARLVQHPVCYLPSPTHFLSSQDELCNIMLQGWNQFSIQYSDSESCNIEWHENRNRDNAGEKARYISIGWTVNTAAYIVVNGEKYVCNAFFSKKIVEPNIQALHYLTSSMYNLLMEIWALNML